MSSPSPGTPTRSFASGRPGPWAACSSRTRPGRSSDLAADASWEVQAQALRSLGHLQDWQTIPILVKGLFSPHWHVRYNAGYGLAAFGLVGILQLQEISRQKEDRFAADMAAMVLDTVVLTGGGS